MVNIFILEPFIISSHEMAQTTTNVVRRTRTGISIPTELFERIDKNKGFDSRSSFIARATVWYLDYLETMKEYENGTMSGAQVPTTRPTVVSSSSFADNNHNHPVQEAAEAVTS